MTLKEELEILRGEPIQVFAGDPMDIPCIETRDAEKLCKHPVVSVSMITYNHESYIRQAIEGVMMQKTDFEFELVIGEDCSTDKTREICFEYQKKYPDKIRVLWWHENVSKLGGNGRRTSTHCRGEFIAFCEGDDYWTDPLKLQKQVDAMRANPSVGLCFCGNVNHDQNSGREWSWDVDRIMPTGLIKGSDFIDWHSFGFTQSSPGPITFIGTQTALVRKAVLEEAKKKFSIFDWRLRLGDSIVWLGVAALSDVYYIPDEVAIYRRTDTGACASSRGGVWLDAFLVRIYFARLLELKRFSVWIKSRVADGFRFLILARLMRLPSPVAWEKFQAICSCQNCGPVFSAVRHFPIRVVVYVAGIRPWGYRLLWRFYKYLKV